MQAMDTRGPGAVSCLLLLAMLTSCLLGAAGRQLHLGNCVINVHTHELKKSVSEIRPSVLREDNHMGLKLLKSQTMKDVKPVQSCCFLRLLMRLYVERVFSSSSLENAQLRRSTSNLANSFLSITKDLRLCHAHKHCHCEEHTIHKFAAIQASFEKLNQREAAVKAMGELDSLLDWMDGFHHFGHHP